jgi:hypothetical protein
MSEGVKKIYFQISETFRTQAAARDISFVAYERLKSTAGTKVPTQRGCIS